MPVSRALTFDGRLNVPALLGGLIAVYLAVRRDPWWVLTSLGQSPTLKVVLSPYLINVEILGRPLTSPIFTCLTTSGLLTVLLAGTTAVVGSMLTTRPWSKRLLGFSMLSITAIFMVSLFVTIKLAESMVGISIPIVGEGEITFSTTYGSTRILAITPVEAELDVGFHLAVVSSALILLGRYLAVSYRRGSRAHPLSDNSYHHCVKGVVT